MPTTVTVSWDEPLSHLGIDEKTVERAIAENVRHYVLNDPEFRGHVVEVIKASGAQVADSAIADSLKHELIHFLRAKVQPLKDELNAVVKDFDNLERTHASDYAARRKKEIIAKLSDLNSL